MNNEQEMFLRKKIEKREKIDTILAYILIVILLGCIVVVVFLKINDKDDVLEPPVNEYIPTYITLNEISNSLNNSNLVSDYVSDGASFSSNVVGNSLSVSYVKDDVNLNLNFPMVGSELMIDIPSDSGDIVTDIYKEIAGIICTFYGNEDRYCRYTLDNMDSNGLDGIRFDNNENSNTVYITTTKSFSVVSEIVYKNVTIVDIEEKDYSLELSDIKVNNINVIKSDTELTMSGNVNRLSEEKNNLSVVVKLYDNENNILGENKYEYNEENVLDTSSTFNISFILSDTLKLENITKYSIEIVR